MQNFSADDLHRATVYDRDGNKVGKVQQVYLDDDSSQPSWVTVNTGLFGTNESLIPLDRAQVNDDVLKVPFDKQVIKEAPNFDPGHHLDESDENALYDYYGVGGQADDDRTRADRVMDRSGDQRTDDHDLAQGRVHDRDSVREPGQGAAAGTAAAGGVGGLAAAAAAGGQDTRDDRGTGHRDDDRRTGLRDDDRETGLGDERGERSSDSRTTVDADRGDSRGGQAGAAFTQGTGQSRDSGLGHEDRAGIQDTDPEPDDRERDLLERERDLLKRERELLDKDRQFMERERQYGGRPRLRRHDPGQL